MILRQSDLHAQSPWSTRGRTLLPLTLSVVLAFLLGSVSSYAGNTQLASGRTQQPDTLALVNGEPITSADFLTRFEMSIYPGKDDPTMLEKTKREFLYSMIAEKLLSQAAVESNTPYTVSEELVRKEMQDVFMRDVLFRREVMPHATVTNQEVLQGFKLSIYRYFVDAFYFNDDKSTAWSFYWALHGKGAPNIYTLASSLHIRHDTLEIPYGESTADIENAFFGHKKGFISKPTATVDGLVIFKVLSREMNQYFIKGSTSARWERIRQILISRKQAELGNDYIENLMKNITVNVNYDIFRPLVYDIQKILENQKQLVSNSKYRLYPPDLVKLGEAFSEDLRNPFLTFPGGDLTLGDVFEQLPLAMFAPADTTLPEIIYALHSSLRFISQNHFLVRRARELGLQKAHEVKYNVDMLLDAFRSYRIANEIMDTVKVTQKEVDDFFRKHHDEVLNAVKLRVRLFEANNINEAIAIYTKLHDEKDEQAAPGDTTAGWVNAYNLGEIGGVLSQLKNGEIYGPVEDGGKFYIYQLLDKRMSINDSAVKNSIEAARQILLTKERREELDRYIAGLAEKDDVRIFRQNVLGVEATPFQMLTYRFIGFGGKILAVPQLYPRAGWVRYFRPNERPPQP
ncbi:MAG: peptidylprolyl isomerase [Bacteroidetes bacterium]|nr:peptidylprolyl isomerase [Bacteroidota bacterium]